MQEDKVWEEINLYLGFLVHTTTTYEILERKRKEQIVRGAPLPFDDGELMNKISQDSYQKIPLREKQYLEGMVSSLNKLTLPKPLHEIKERLTEMLRDRNSQDFEDSITAGGIRQWAGELAVESGEILLKGKLSTLLDRIELRDGTYHLKQ